MILPPLPLLRSHVIRRSHLHLLRAPRFVRTMATTNADPHADMNDHHSRMMVEDMIQSSQHYYGSLHDAGGRHNHLHHHKRLPSVADHTGNDGTGNTAADSIMQALVQEQTRTIQSIVPWFLDNMPASYFQQIPTPYRMQHIKAISAITDANMDLNINLQQSHHTHPDDATGRHVYTYIRPTTQSGTLLQMVQELPPPPPRQPLSRLHVFSTKDESLSLTMFIYGPPQIIWQKIHRSIASTTANNVDMVPDPTVVTNMAETYVRQIGKPILEAAASLQSSSSSVSLSSDELVHYMVHNCTETYIRISNHDPMRFLQQFSLVKAVSGNVGTSMTVTPVAPTMTVMDETLTAVDGGGSTSSSNSVETKKNYYWIDVAVSNSISQLVLENLCHLLYVHKFDVVRARLDVMPPILPPAFSSTSPPPLSNDSSETVTLLRTLVTPTSDHFVAGSDPQQQQLALQSTFDTLVHEMKRAKWIDPLTHELVFQKHPSLGVTRGEIITGLCSALHPTLSKINSIAYSTTNIYDKVSHPRFITYAKDIADLFLDRFRPESPLPDHEFQMRCDQIGAAIDTNVEDTMASIVLHKMIHVVQHTLKTNVYMPDRYALAFRLDPACMSVIVPPSLFHNPANTVHQVPSTSSNSMAEQPYGVIFVHGRRFNGFHVRFRDIARGGLRLVTPSTAEQYALESARHYDECYGLAYAQQLKNKDIPEGGSKAVALIQTYGLSDTAKALVMRKSVKAMTDAILDLIVDTDYTKKHLVDLWGQKEVLYLGPDEQVIPADIEWIVRRAGERGYDTPAAFMSSKPRAGINHKVYGVTSEGVNVYLDVALRNVLGIDPKQDAFTVKITGGPDGDVAGNEIKILIREYGSNAKIIGIADHSGCVEDPDGLDHEELLRLFHASLCISHFDVSKLAPQGVMHTVDTPEGVKARNSMHSRLDADAFLPCGGRPNTIDSTNYKQFLKADGCTPTSKLIVEGANLFLTADARKALFQDAGVIIVKDSSANKGGVITSSYEICAAMLLTEDEFFDQKEQIVQEVLDKLRGLAKLEADLLFREFDDYDGLSLPEVSQIISHCINATTDALSIALDSLPLEDRKDLLPLFRSHLPKTIADLAFDRIDSHVPEQYIKNAIASCLASKMVYKEGTKFITSLPTKKLAHIALQYIHNEREIAILMEALNNSNMKTDDKEIVQNLLERGGARTALRLPTTKAIH